MTDPPELSSCPRLANAFLLFGKRWNAVIVDLLLQRPARFHELAEAVDGLSQRVLTERLRELEQAGVIDREVATGPPIAVTYSLTKLGKRLGPAMDAMREWSDARAEAS